MVEQCTSDAGPLGLAVAWPDGLAVVDAVVGDGDDFAPVELLPHPAIASIKTRAAPLARTA